MTVQRGRKIVLVIWNQGYVLDRARVKAAIKAALSIEGYPYLEVWTRPGALSL